MSGKEFFERFGKATGGQTFEDCTPTHKIAAAIAEEWEATIEPGHGMFFDFSTTPELRQPVLETLIYGFNWRMERTDFIRKPV